MGEQGIYFINSALSGFFVLYILIQISPLKQGLQKRTVFCLLVYWWAAGFGTTICQIKGWLICGTMDSGWLSKMVYMLLVFLIIGQFIEGGIIRLIVTITISDVIMSCTELLWSILAFLIFRDSVDYSLWQQNTSILGQTLLLLACDAAVCFLPTKLYRRIRSVPFEKYIMAKAIAIGYTILGVVTLKIRYSALDGNADSFRIYMSIACVMIIVIVLYACFEDNRLYRRTNRQLFLQEQMQREYVHLLEEQTALTRKFRHDIRKHLDMVSFLRDNDTGIRDSEPLKTYENNLLELCRELTTGDYCSSSEVNAVFYQLEIYCSRNGLDFQARIRNISFDTIVSRGDTLIFLNAVNWMMEQCERLKKQGVLGKGVGVELSGAAMKGVNTLSLILHWQEYGEGMKDPESGGRGIPQDEHIRAIQWRLKAYGEMVDTFTGDRERRLTICWK